MNIKLLALDVGNSAVKAGFFQGNVLEEVSRLPSRADGLEEFLVRKLPQADGICLACVVPSLREGVLRLSAALGKPLVEAGTQAAGGLRLGYTKASRLGSDRIAAAVGAVARAGMPCLVADLGTATTVDAVSPEGILLGGAILPGVGFFLEAPSWGTASLPEVAPEILATSAPVSSIGRDTLEGILAGAYWGLAGAVEALAARHQRQMGREAPLLLTGGWSRVLLAAFTVPAKEFPDLTLEGLAEIYRRARR